MDHFGDIDVIGEKDRVRETLGYLPQSFGFHPRVSDERLLERAGIDPHNKLIDRDRGDNVVAVERRVN